MKIAKQQIRSRKWHLPQIRFHSEQMTSFAGLIIFHPLFERLALRRRLQHCCRHLPCERQYPVARVIQLLMVHLLLGFRRLRDIEYYQEDPIVRRVSGMKQLPTVSTLSRTLAGCDDFCVSELEATTAQLVLQRLGEEKLARVTLEFDGSVLSTRRHAEGTAVGFNRKRKGQHSYYPLFCTIAQSGQVLGVLHRSGNVHDSNGAIGFVRRCVQQVREALPGAKLEIRMDSAFFSNEMVRTLEGLKVQYTISVPFERLAALKEMIEGRRVWWRFETWNTLRRNLLLKAGRLTRPNGRWTLTFNKNSAVEALLHRARRCARSRFERKRRESAPGQNCNGLQESEPERN